LGRVLSISSHCAGVLCLHTTSRRRQVTRELSDGRADSDQCMHDELVHSCHIGKTQNSRGTTFRGVGLSLQVSRRGEHVGARPIYAPAVDCNPGNVGSRSDDRHGWSAFIGNLVTDVHRLITARARSGNVGGHLSFSAALGGDRAGGGQRSARLFLAHVVRKKNPRYSDFSLVSDCPARVDMRPPGNPDVVGSRSLLRIGHARCTQVYCEP
jgi:hypothetical protein